MGTTNREGKLFPSDNGQIVVGPSFQHQNVWVCNGKVFSVVALIFTPKPTVIDESDNEVRDKMLQHKATDITYY